MFSVVASKASWICGEIQVFCRFF